MADQGIELEDDEDVGGLEDLLPSPDDGPDAVAIRQLLLEHIEAALDELPPEQRDVFIAHEIDGRSFKELAAETGLSINTLLSRKRYAVLHLRKRLQAIHAEFDTVNAAPNKSRDSADIAARSESLERK